MQGALMFAEVASYYASKGMTVLMVCKFGKSMAYEITRLLKCQVLVVKRNGWINGAIRKEHLTEINGAKVVKIQDFETQETIEETKDSLLASNLMF